MHLPALYWIVCNLFFLSVSSSEKVAGWNRWVGKVSFLKCLVIVNIVTAWFIYIRLLNACSVVFFSLWEISDGVCVILLPARACVSVYVRIKECASPLLWITSVYALHVFVLCVRLGVSVTLMSILPVCVRACRCMWRLLSCLSLSVGVVYCWCMACVRAGVSDARCRAKNHDTYFSSGRPVIPLWFQDLIPLARFSLPYRKAVLCFVRVPTCFPVSL